MVGSRGGWVVGHGKWRSSRLWSIANDRELPNLLPAASITAPKPAKFSPDGELVATTRIVDNKSVLSVWRIEDAVLVGGIGGAVRDFAFMPDGRRIAVASIGVFVTPFDHSWALDTICGIARRDLTDEEWDEYAGGLDRVRACP